VTADAAPRPRVVEAVPMVVVVDNGRDAVDVGEVGAHGDGRNAWIAPAPVLHLVEPPYHLDAEAVSLRDVVIDGVAATRRAARERNCRWTTSAVDCDSGGDVRLRARCHDVPYQVSLSLRVAGRETRRPLVRGRLRARGRRPACGHENGRDDQDDSIHRPYPFVVTMVAAVRLESADTSFLNGLPRMP